MRGIARHVITSHNVTIVTFLSDVFWEGWIIWAERVKNEECYEESLYLHRASIVPKTLFIIPTDAHNYKIIGMLKTI